MACALSSITKRLCVLAMRKISSMFAAWPYKWTGTIALVLEVIFFSILFGSILKLIISGSTGTTLAPVWVTANQVAI